MRNDIKGVAFDLDGTLYPNYRFNIRLLPFILREWSLLSAFGKARKKIRNEQLKNPEPRDCFYEYQAGIVAELLKNQSRVMQDKINTLIYTGWEPMFKKIKLFDKVIPTLTALKKAGYKLGLLSDFPVNVKLDYLGLSGFWDATLCSEHYGTIKPHPLSFLKLASAMNLPCGQILYVGNSRSYDVTGANNAGMKTAWIKSVFFPGRGLKKPKPDFTFSNYRQLYDYMIN